MLGCLTLLNIAEDCVFRFVCIQVVALHTCFGHDGGRDAMPEHQQGCVIDIVYTIVSESVKVNCSTLIGELDKSKGVCLVTLSAQA